MTERLTEEGKCFYANLCVFPENVFKTISAETYCSVGCFPLVLRKATV